MDRPKSTCRLASRPALIPQIAASLDLVPALSSGRGFSSMEFPKSRFVVRDGLLDPSNPIPVEAAAEAPL